METEIIPTVTELEAVKHKLLFQIETVPLLFGQANSELTTINAALENIEQLLASVVQGKHS